MMIVVIFHLGPPPALTSTLQYDMINDKAVRELQQFKWTSFRRAKLLMAE